MFKLDEFKDGDQPTKTIEIGGMKINVTINPSMALGHVLLYGSRGSMDGLLGMIVNAGEDDSQPTPIQQATVTQPTPKGEGEDIARLVRKDIEYRAEVGEEKYGERLKPFNGRSSLVDAYQEALDLCMYLRQLIEEEKSE